MEFGVHTGGTITLASNWRTQYCSEKSPVVYGFDTFTGLPERWYGNFASVRPTLNELLPLLRCLRLTHI